MNISADSSKHTLTFRKPARTSRGELLSHTVYYLRLQTGDHVGYGEASPLPGLSIDNLSEWDSKLRQTCDELSQGARFEELDLEGFPALRFGVETALRSLRSDFPFLLFSNSFTQRTMPIHINGLVWMAGSEEMLMDALTKADAGFDCIKFKVGALDFDEECRMLEQFRKRFNAFKVSVRLDANGAFAGDEALEKLRELQRFELHSIEQPIQPGQWEMMAEIVSKSPVPVALDEELIGMNMQEDGQRMLKEIKPSYLILKPTLLGGIDKCEQWISMARALDIGWWATSALESDIGLNAISQWCANYELTMPQGLGTGRLYTANAGAGFTISEGKLYCSDLTEWRYPSPDMEQS